MGLVQRHASGDWGNLSAEDKAENELSLREGFRILLAYELEGARYWVILRQIDLRPRYFCLMNTDGLPYLLWLA